LRSCPAIEKDVGLGSARHRDCNHDRHRRRGNDHLAPRAGQAWTRSVVTTSSTRSADASEPRGVGFEDRQDLLGYRSGRITSHCSAAELSRLIEAAEKVCERDGRGPEMVVLRGALATYSRKEDRSLSGSAVSF
jgi:hypothetical protein